MPFVLIINLHVNLNFYLTADDWSYVLICLYIRGLRRAMENAGPENDGANSRAKTHSCPTSFTHGSVVFSSRAFLSTTLQSCIFCPSWLARCVKNILMCPCQTHKAQRGGRWLNLAAFVRPASSANCFSVTGGVNKSREIFWLAKMRQTRDLVQSVVASVVSCSLIINRCVAARHAAPRHVPVHALY